MDSITLVGSLQQLTPEQLATLCMLFARGYTVRTVKARMQTEFGIEMTNEALLRGGVQYAEDIEKVRKELAENAVQVGLARKEERIRRLGELAEAYEEPAIKGGTKAAGVYLKTLSQIQSETEPLGLKVAMDEEDPWMLLLKKLKPSSLPGALLPDQTPQTSE